MVHSLRLRVLKIRNFKGIREFVLDAHGGNVSVYGDNGTGKTTLQDAWSWLWSDKDSSGRATFDIKPLDENNQPIHNLESEVGAELDADGREVTLRKVYSEKWTKKRGSSVPELTGHSTDYYIDGVPVGLSEFRARLTQIADESTMRMVSDPRYFNEQLHWKERRKKLLDICGDVTDQDVIASTAALSELPSILGSRSLDDHRRVLEARRKELDKELKAIPVRIDEATRALPAANGNKSMISAEIGRLTQMRKDKQAELARIEAGAEVVEKQKQLRQIEIDMLEAEKRQRADADKAIREERATLAGVNDQIEAKRKEQRRLREDHDDGSRKAQALQTRLVTLRHDWKVISDRTFTSTVDAVCPTCGQAIPPEEVEAAREKALADFNARKSAELEANVTEGKRLAAEMEALQAQQQERDEAISRAERALNELNMQAGEIQNGIDRLANQSSSPEYQQLQKDKGQVEQDLTDLKAGGSPAKQAITDAIADLDRRIDSLQADVAKIDQRQGGLDRIEELRAQETKLAAEAERVEREYYLTDEFIRAKVTMLQDKINGRFQYARFKLFSPQLNGGFEECCETLYRGVPYTTNLNTGAEINVGLDIINTLSAHYGFSAPIWIDNAEAVTRLIPVKAQVIRLVVSKPDERLRVENEAPAEQREAV